MRYVLITAIAATCLLGSPSTGAWAGKLRYATPDTPVAFTFPAVRYWAPKSHAEYVVRRKRVAKRVPAARRAYRTTRIAHRHGCQPPRTQYAYPPTGYTPLPYEFGPWCAAIVSRY
jgi:hypothetical protein